MGTENTLLFPHQKCLYTFVIFPIPRHRYYGIETPFDMQLIQTNVVHNY